MFKKMPVMSILAGATLWGSMCLFVRSLSEIGFTDVEKVFYRGLFSVIILFIYLLIFDRKALYIKLRDIWMFIGTGIISFETFGLFYFYTINNGDASVAAILLYTAPAFVMIMSAVLFGERFTKKKLAALIFTVLGCALVSGIGGKLNVTKITLFTGLMSGFCYALYSVFGSFALKKYSSFTVTFYTFVFSTIGTIPLINLGHLTGLTFSSLQMPAYLFMFAVVTALMPYALYTGGLKYMEAGKASICASLEPVVATVLGIVILGESAKISVILGIAFVIAGITVMNLNDKNK